MSEGSVFSLPAFMSDALLVFSFDDCGGFFAWYSHGICSFGIVLILRKFFQFIFALLIVLVG